MIHNIVNQLIHFYEIFIFIFSVTYILIYVILSFLSYYAISKHLRYQKFISEDILTRSNHVLGVSIVAPAFNEGVNIVYNVKSLLSLTYPKYEIIIINDGSTDDTLTKLITDLTGMPIIFMTSLSGKYKGGFAHIDAFIGYNFYYLKRGQKKVWIVPDVHWP